MQGRGDRALTNVHADPAKYGTKFGKAVVTVDLDLGDCVVRAPRPGLVHPVIRPMRLHSLQEIEATYLSQMGNAAVDPIANDIADALKFAAQQIRDKEGKRQ